MKNIDIKSLLKTIIIAILWAITFLIMGYLIAEFKNYNLKDVLFIEGIVSVFIGVFSLISGNPMGLSMQAMGSLNAQYVATENLRVTDVEKSKKIKAEIKNYFNAASLILGGIIYLF